MDSSWKTSWRTFFFSCLSYLPFWSYAPLKKSDWNQMHAISYEPCMLGFWNFIYGKIADPYFFSCPSYLPFWSYASLKQIRLSIWDRGLKLGQVIWVWWVDYLIKLNKKKKIFYFSGVMVLWKFGHFKRVSKISRKLFELGAWNLVSW